jgi:hypothetical protein
MDIRIVDVQLRQQDLTWHVAGDEVVVLDLADSVYLKLNGTARTLWERLAEPCDSAELCELLVERYDIDEDRAADDVGGFLDDLRRRGLVEG